MPRKKTKALIKKLKALGITKWRMSRVVGVHWNTVNMWERGYFEAREDKQEKLRQLLKETKEAQCEK